jgi:hypothetical protein
LSNKPERTASFSHPFRLAQGHCRSLILPVLFSANRAFVALTQGLEQRTRDALHGAHAALPRENQPALASAHAALTLGSVKTLGVGILCVTLPE